MYGYSKQTKQADEIIIADDGSEEATKNVIDEFKGILPIKHIWQEDNGFRKCEIMNKALIAAQSDYLIFTDQDCIPRNDFIATHYRLAKEGQFLSGGYFKMNMSISKNITCDDIDQARIFSLKWLIKHGQNITFKMSKLIRSSAYSWIMNIITPARASWNGCNSSGWRKDMLAINGFNEEMKYGGEDREFGERLVNYGIRPRQIRYSAIVMHLDHSRPYATKESSNKNKLIRETTRKDRLVRTPNGIEKLG